MPQRARIPVTLSTLFHTEASVKGALKEAISSRSVEDIPQASLRVWMDVDAENLWQFFDR